LIGGWDTVGYPRIRLSATLPRLGSRVRIPSPAPGFLKEIKKLEDALRGVFCFPDIGAKIGEAGGKQRKARSSGLWVAFEGSLCRPGAIPKGPADGQNHARGLAVEAEFLCRFDRRSDDQSGPRTLHGQAHGCQDHRSEIKPSLADLPS